MKKFNVLIVEDDQELAELTSDFLKQFEFDCSIENNGEKAIKRILSEEPDLVLLDVMLPDVDGLQICREVQGNISSKIIMLTARTDTIDQVLGLELGADDYVPKPVEPRLLLARIRAVLRREPKQVRAKKDECTFADFSLNRHKRELRQQGQLLDLNTPEYDLLCLLLDNSGEVVTREQIFKQLRGIEYDGQSRQVDILISNLRAKLEANQDCPTLIKTVRSKGYVFIGEIG